MPSPAPQVEIIALDRVRITRAHWSWPFAVTHRQEIDRHFSSRRRQQPALWNGRVLLLNAYAIRDGGLHGVCFETDYASFLAWRDWDFPDPSVFNIFAAAALQADDGAYLVGEMAASTAGAGQLCFPCGTPDPADVGAEGELDLAGSLGRELLEETGIDIASIEVAPGWTLVRDRSLLALMKRLAASQDAPTLRSRIKRHLASERQPELSDIRFVRAPGDLDGRMPNFLVAFLEQAWRPGLAAMGGGGRERGLK